MPVSAFAARLVIDRLHDRSSVFLASPFTLRTAAYLWKVLGLLASAPKDKHGWTEIPSRVFPSRQRGTRLLRAMVSVGLLECCSWNSWKRLPYHRERPRRFRASAELGLALLRGPCATSPLSAIRRRWVTPPAQRRALVVLNPASGVPIAECVVSALMAGTGLMLCPAWALTCVSEMPAARAAALVRCLLPAVGASAAEREIVPDWSQKASGRLYAKSPALCSLPKKLRPALIAVGGMPLFELDFRAFELCLALNMARESVPERDPYGMIADHAGLSRDEAKDFVNPILHGCREANILYNRRKPLAARVESAEKHRACLAALESVFPKVNDWIEQIERDKGRHVLSERLQRRGAEVFLAGLSAALDSAVTAAGLPLHDGWVFAAPDLASARAVTDQFAAAARLVLGDNLHVRLKPLRPGLNA